MFFIMGIKTNFLYNLFLTLSNYIVGLIIFPYISRVFGVSNVGIIGFVDNSINYFILFATMGISTIGAREIARVKGNKNNLNTVFNSLLALSSVFLAVVVILYFALIYAVPNFLQYKNLFLIGSAKLIFTVYSIEWFYRGIENFKFISIRNGAIKISYLILIFLFVNKKDDVEIYFFITVLSIVVSSLINIWYSRRFISFSFKNITIKPFVKQVLYIGSYSLLTSMYTTFNIMYLGFVSSSTEVGYYWTALKVYTIILGFYTAFTGVMMPRMSGLVARKEFDVFKELIKKSFDLLLSLVLPIIIVSTILAPQLIFILSGDGYEGAITPMQIIMPLLLVVGVAQIVAIQVLLPLKHDSQILRASIIGAVIGVLGNLIFVAKYGSIGTAYVLLISEVVVTLYYVVYSHRKKIVLYSFSRLKKHIFNLLPYIVANLILIQQDFNNFIAVGLALCVNGLIFLLLQFFYIKNEFVYKYILVVMGKLEVLLKNK